MQRGEVKLSEIVDVTEYHFDLPRIPSQILSRFDT